MAMASTSGGLATTIAVHFKEWKFGFEGGNQQVDVMLLADADEDIDIAFVIQTRDNESSICLL
jgi:hypothetical protein